MAVNTPAGRFRKMEAAGCAATYAMEQPSGSPNLTQQWWRRGRGKAREKVKGRAMATGRARARGEGLRVVSRGETGQAAGHRCRGSAGAQSCRWNCTAECQVQRGDRRQVRGPWRSAPLHVSCSVGHHTLKGALTQR